MVAPAPVSTSAASRPPARARSSAPTTNTLPTRPLTRSAAATTSSTAAPAAAASAASQAPKATAKEALAVSTMRTGTGEPAAARRAELTVPEREEPMWTETMATAPASARDW